MVTCVYLLNLGVMNNKIETFNIYTMVANEHEGEKEESNEQPKEDELGIEKFAATNVHIHTIRLCGHAIQPWRS
jgi:hypothetical protein